MEHVVHEARVETDRAESLAYITTASSLARTARCDVRRRNTATSHGPRIAAEWYARAEGQVIILAHKSADTSN